MQKISFSLTFLTLLLANVAKAQTFYTPSPFAHTYSILAYDSGAGEMGVAVQSHWFSVGPVGPWGEAGVGVVATQSLANVSFGVRGLGLLQQGLSPRQVVDSLLPSDEGREYRQLAVVDAKGRVAAYTGEKCIPEAGHIIGDGYAVQANLMLNDKVWPVMAKAFEEAKGPLAERMIAALEAAQEVGGDIRGQQSAAILMVKGQSTGKIWEVRQIDLRVEDHPEPVKELKRLLNIHRAYQHMNQGELAIEQGDMELAMREYGLAEKMFPENEEMRFWHAVTLVNNGRTKEALSLFGDVFAKDRNWVTLTPRLVKVGLLNVDQQGLDRILSALNK